MTYGDTVAWIASLTDSLSILDLIRLEPRKAQDGGWLILATDLEGKGGFLMDLGLVDYNDKSIETLVTILTRSPHPRPESILYMN